VLYDKYKEHSVANGQMYIFQREEDRESVDTYLEEMGNDHYMPSFKPAGLRQTARPDHLKEKDEERNANWHH
jgi:hypothetical protein